MRINGLNGGTLVLLAVSTVLALSAGAYAAALPTPNIHRLGGTGIQIVQSPSTTPLGIGWSITNSQIDGVNVKWTPDVTGNFEIEVEVADGAGTGKVTVPGTADVEQTDLVPISPAVDVENVNTAEVTIKED